MVTRAVGDCECDAMMDRGDGEVGARVLCTDDSVHRYIIGARTKRLSQHAAAVTASQRRVSLLYVVLPASDQRKKRSSVPPGRRIQPLQFRYDTIREAILRCAQTLTQVSLIYRTEPVYKVEKRKN